MEEWIKINIEKSGVVAYQWGVSYSKMPCCSVEAGRHLHQNLVWRLNSLFLPQLDDRNTKVFLVLAD